ncbi:MAG: hypothetical protein ACREFO_05225 [Acetobacteraceae bacterium]
MPPAQAGSSATTLTDRVDAGWRLAPWLIHDQDRRSLPLPLPGVSIGYEIARALVMNDLRSDNYFFCGFAFTCSAALTAFWICGFTQSMRRGIQLHANDEGI